MNEKVMEIENEIGFVNDGTTKRFPEEFWPLGGDRVWMMGRYIFDCGHPPPRRNASCRGPVAFTHFEPLILSSAGPQPRWSQNIDIHTWKAAGRASAIYDAPIGGDSQNLMYRYRRDLLPRLS